MTSGIVITSEIGQSAAKLLPAAAWGPREKVQRLSGGGSAGPKVAAGLRYSPALQRCSPRRNGFTPAWSLGSGGRSLAAAVTSWEQPYHRDNWLVAAKRS